jgi:mRNA interferase MazF
VNIEPWQVWWVDLNPIVGREQAGTRPAIIVSSRFHLALTGGALMNVLPMTTRERPGWMHRIRIDIPDRPVGYAITEQVRTVARTRVSGNSPLYTLSAEQVLAVRTVLSKMIDL